MIKEAKRGYFGLEFAGILIFVPRRFFCYLDLKPLISLSFLPSADFVAGEFTVYKKSRIDPHDLSIS
jgi:hypothetical protein